MGNKTKFIVIPTRNYINEVKKLLKKYPSIISYLRIVIDSLEENPVQGESLGKGLYKIRIKVTSKGKGKRGGARLITLVQVIEEIVNLITIYDKSDKENISNNDLAQMINKLTE